jgi:hypothetical protein
MRWKKDIHECSKLYLFRDLIQSITDICSEKGNNFNEIGSLVQSPATCNITKNFVESLDIGPSALCTKPITRDSFRDITQVNSIYTINGIN